MPDGFADELIESYSKLRLFALSITSNLSDADDLAQATIERALNKRAQFSGGSVEAWTITIAKNLHKDQKKAAYSRLRYDGPFDEENILDEASVSDAESKTMLKQVINIIDGLGERCRTLLLLSAQGYKTREIAKWLNIPDGTAGRNMMECRAKLCDAIGSKD